MAIVHDGSLELWSVDDAQQVWTRPLPSATSQVSFAADEASLRIDGADHATKDGAPTSAPRDDGARDRKHWRPTDDGRGARFEGLDPATLRRLAPFAARHALRVETQGIQTTASPSSPDAEVQVTASDDVRVIAVTRRDPPASYVAGIDLTSGKTWRTDAWTTGAGSSTEELLTGRPGVRTASLAASWGPRNDRLIVSSTVTSGNEVRVAHRVLDALSGKTVKDFGADVPRFTPTGARVFARGLFEVDGGKRIEGPWDEADVSTLSFSEADERVAILGAHGCDVLERRSQHRLLHTTSLARTRVPRPGVVCAGNSIVTRSDRGTQRWSLEDGAITELGSGSFLDTDRLALDASGKAATVATPRVIHRIDLATFDLRRATWVAPAETPHLTPPSAVTPSGERYAIVVAKHVSFRSFTGDTVVQGKTALPGDTASIAFSFDGTQAVTVGSDARGVRVHVIDATSGAVRELLAGRLLGRRVNAVDHPRLLAIHPSTSRAAIAVAGSDVAGSKAEVVVVDFRTGKEIFAFSGRLHTPEEVAFAADGSLLLLDDSEPSIWNETTGVRRLPDLRGLKLDVADAARFGVDPILAVWKDVSFGEGPGFGNVSYCAAGGPRVWLDDGPAVARSAAGARLVVQRRDGAVVRLFHVRADGLNELLAIDPTGAFQAPGWLDSFFRAPIPGGTDDFTLGAATPGLLRSFVAR